MSLTPLLLLQCDFFGCDINQTAVEVTPKELLEAAGKSGWTFYQNGEVSFCPRHPNELPKPLPAAAPGAGGVVPDPCSPGGRAPEHSEVQQ